MSKWYYAKEGLAHGPVTDEELWEQLKQGTLTEFDLVFRAGETVWRPLGECELLEQRVGRPSELHQNVQLPAQRRVVDASAPAIEWVILTKKTKLNETHFVQQGPYSTARVRQMIEAQEVDGADHAWREGFSRWQRLGEIEEFDRRAVAAGETPQASDESSEEPAAETAEVLLHEAIDLTRDQLKNFVAAAEVGDSNTSLGPSVRAAEVVEAEREPDRAAPAPALKGASSAKEEPDSPAISMALPRPVEEKEGGQRHYMRRFAMLVGATTLVFLIYQISAQRLLSAWSEGPREAAGGARPDSEPPSLAPQKSERKKGESAVVEGPGPRKTQARRQPPQLQLKTKGLTGASPALVIHNNGAHGDVISVELKGVTAQIIGAPSYYRRLDLKARSGEPLRVALKRLSVPNGWIRVDVALATARRSAEFFVGSRDGFERRLLSDLKRRSFYQQREKNNLFRLVKSHLSQTEKLYQTFRQKRSKERWRRFYSDWERGVRRSTVDELESFTPQTRDRYSFPDLWVKLKRARQRLLKQARRIDRAALQKRSTAATPDRLVRQLRQLKREVSRLSVQKPIQKKL